MDSSKQQHLKGCIWIIFHSLIQKIQKQAFIEQCQCFDFVNGKREKISEQTRCMDEKMTKYLGTPSENLKCT